MRSPRSAHTSGSRSNAPAATRTRGGDGPMKPMTEEHLTILRRHMVDVIAIHADVTSDELGKAKLDDRVMAAMRTVRRHHFVPAPLAALAYQDTPLPIGFDKTVS